MGDRPPVISVERRLEDPTFTGIKDFVLSKHPQADMSLPEKAWRFAEEIHMGQVRKSGEPSVSHAIKVAWYLALHGMDPKLIAAGLLVDAIEDGNQTKESLKSLFGEEVANLVEGVSKIGHIEYDNQAMVQAKSYRRMISAVNKDLRVLIIKLVDCCLNMHSLEHLEADKRKRISQEALEVYAPLANRIGLNHIKADLEQLAFYYLEPEAFADLEEQMSEHNAQNQTFFDATIATLKESLAGFKVEAEVESRVKNHYSIHRKMVRKNRSLAGIYDYYAFRILTNTVTDCYRTLGLLHGKWRHIPGRIKDFIATPKENLYQSLHTTLISNEGTPFEVQIRTKEMHKIAEDGILCHWSFEDGDLPQNMKGRVTKWFREFSDQNLKIEDHHEFLEQMKGQLQVKNIIVFTPQSETKSLPPGSTPLDFAYLIHTDVGHQAVGARINGEKATLKTKLKSGDIVQIITDPNQTPQPEWLNLAATPLAKNRIRFKLRKEMRRRARDFGRIIFERELACYKGAPKSLSREAISAKVDHFGKRRIEDFYSAIASGELPPYKAVKPFIPPDSKPIRDTSPGGGSSSRISRAFKNITRSRRRILVRGPKDPLLPLSTCCHPIIGDPIIGVLNKGMGIHIHRSDCEKIQKINADRLVAVEWDSPKESRLFRTEIKVLAEEKEGMLADISKAIADAKTNICQLNAKSNDSGEIGVVEIEIQIHAPGQLEKVVQNLKKIEGLISVER